MRKEYKPLGIPKVKMPKIANIQVKMPKVKKPRITILDRRIN